MIARAALALVFSAASVAGARACPDAPRVPLPKLREHLGGDKLASVEGVLVGASACAPCPPRHTCEACDRPNLVLKPAADAAPETQVVFLLDAHRAELRSGTRLRLVVSRRDAEEALPRVECLEEISAGSKRKSAK